MKYKRGGIVVHMNTRKQKVMAAGFIALAAISSAACSSRTDGHAAVSAAPSTSASPYEYDPSTAGVTGTPTTQRAVMERINVSAVAGMSDGDAVAAVARAAKSWYIADLGVSMPTVQLYPSDSTQLECAGDTRPHTDAARTCPTALQVQWSQPYVAKMRDGSDSVHRVYSIMALMGHELGHIAQRVKGTDTHDELQAECLSGAFARAQGVPAAEAGRGAGTAIAAVDSRSGAHDDLINAFADGYDVSDSTAVWSTCAAVK